MGTVVAAIITALVAVFITTRINLNDSLDSKSGWRKDLFEIACKENISLKDVHTMRTALRLYPHAEDSTNLFSFRWMTNIFIEICQYLIRKYKPKRTTAESEQTQSCNEDTYISDNHECEIVRICCRYLLKNHWEARSSFPIINGSLDNRANKFQPFAAKTIELILKELKGD